MQKPLGTRLLADLREVFSGWSDPIAVGSGIDGAIYAAARRSTEAPTESRGAVFPKSRLEQATDYKLIRWKDGETQCKIISGEALAVSFVQPVPGGILLAGARCYWRPEGPEKNALIVDWSGHELARLTLGDGIEDMRVTPNGMVWVSYFDEGVFGNYGWGNPGPPPIGSPGLVAFSQSGEVCFSYDHEAAGTDDICDAYAMNVAGESDVWLYFYAEFSIVRILDGGYHVWRFDIGGARGLAVRRSRVLLFGDYKRRNLGRLVELGSDRVAKVVDEVAVVDDQGKPLTDARVWGVGGDLFFFTDRRVMVAEDW